MSGSCERCLLLAVRNSPTLLVHPSALQAYFAPRRQPTGTTMLMVPVSWVSRVIRGNTSETPAVALSVNPTEKAPDSQDTDRI